MTWMLRLVAILALATLPGAARAEASRGEVSIRSTTPAGPEAYLDGTGPAVTVTGTLRLPTGEGIVAAVILTHSGGGVES